MRPQGGSAELATLFILGAPRSGTSWLYKLLCLHPGAAWISNYVRRVPWAPQAAVLNRLAYRAPVLRSQAWFPDGEAYVYDRPRALVARMFPAPVEGEPLFVRAGAVPGAGVAMDPGRLQRSVGRLIAASGGQVFISKRINHNRRVAELRRAFPGMRIVHLVRDGRDVVASLLRVRWWADESLWWGDGATVAQWLDRGADPCELAARHWLAEVTAASQGLDEVDPALSLTVRYEELVDEGLPRLEQILRFGQLEPTRRWRSDVRGVLQAHRRPKTVRSAKTPRVVLDIQAAELVRLGYEL